MISEDILALGVEALCKSDSDIKSIIAPRSKDIIDHLNLYIKEIETFNPAYGLVGASSTDELVIKHILDSLAPLGIIVRLLGEKKLSGIRIADAGSGAGLPGIPLAITLPNCDFSLIERMGRRAGFLMNTKAALSITNINIEEKELEKTSGCFDLITFRAFKPIEPKILKSLFKICAADGIIAAYKGRLDRIKEEMAQLQVYWETIPCIVPFLDEERHLLVIKPEK